ncbi:A/G-specific adenine glycosylase [Cryptosporangium phraense]|uniref:Adenine DNA glycosylase n=1 Tax=Cryptosporangium phraense TaxID=2593070 RepID=A0A545AGY0_9ACTN|nr:A/G-specific adenine glycosylase [Cryptosporangium phraense]TQS40564.1 A/G-specific adenine glycosylase [Cryptosporangium phraense]
MSTLPFVAHVLDWYDENARDLPWRTADASPWGVLVSEIMLQQTPVSRVLPAWQAWMSRWPTPTAMAADEPGEAVRMWGRLGYPRRALRLHECAVAITTRHDGELPTDLDALLALPGVGAYTARAIASFAYGQRHAVVDTNVRRVLSRVVTGVADTAPGSAARDLALAEPLVPDDPAVAAKYAVAVMELGALVCTARAPRCADCPVVDDCAWFRAGKPAYDGPAKRPQGYAGTDRQVRGRLLAVLRDATGPVPQGALDVVWNEPVQRARALDGLVADGLVDPLPDGTYALPGAARAN